jgi:hypothetical protein
MDYIILHPFISGHFNHFIPIRPWTFAPATPRNVPSKSTWKEMIHLPGAKKTLRVTEPDFRISHILVILYNIDISMWYLSNWYIYIYIIIYIYYNTYNIYTYMYCYIICCIDLICVGVFMLGYVLCCIRWYTFETCWWFSTLRTIDHSFPTWVDIFITKWTLFKQMDPPNWRLPWYCHGLRLPWGGAILAALERFLLPQEGWLGVSQLA